MIAIALWNLTISVYINIACLYTVLYSFQILGFKMFEHIRVDVLLSDTIP